MITHTFYILTIVALGYALITPHLPLGGVSVVGEASDLGSMPTIPFEVEYQAYGRTIEVVGSCEKRTDAITLKFKSTDRDISKAVFAAVNKSFDLVGVKRVQICRVSKLTTWRASK